MFREETNFLGEENSTFFAPPASRESSSPEPVNPEMGVTHEHAFTFDPQSLSDTVIQQHQPRISSSARADGGLLQSLRPERSEDSDSGGEDSTDSSLEDVFIPAEGVVLNPYMTKSRVWYLCVFDGTRSYMRLQTDVEDTGMMCSIHIKRLPIHQPYQEITDPSEVTSLLHMVAIRLLPSEKSPITLLQLLKRLFVHIDDVRIALPGGHVDVEQFLKIFLPTPRQIMTASFDDQEIIEPFFALKNKMRAWSFEVEEHVVSD